MNDPAMAINITGNDADAARMMARQQRDIDKLKGAYRELAQQGKETGDSLHIGSGVVGEIAGLAAGYLSVGKAMELAGAAAETWRTLLKETTEATREAVEASKSFAAMQTGAGSNVLKPTQAMMKMAAEIGIKDMGPVMVLAGGLQASLGGDVAGARRETLEMLKLHQVTNQPLEELLDVGKLAGAKGRDPGEFARKIAAAARETNLDPSIISRGAKSMGSFANDDEWIAVQAELAKQLGPRGATAVGQLPGLFMEGAPKEFTAWAKKQGIGKGTPFMEALGKLHAGGFTTVQSLEKSGLGLDERAALAMAAGKQPAIASLAARLPAMGTEAELQKRHEQIIGQYPETAAVELTQKLEAQHEYQKVFSPEALERRINDRELQILGKAYERTGNRTFLGLDQLDDSGRATTGGGAITSWLGRVGMGILQPFTTAKRIDAINREVEKIRSEEGEGGGIESGMTYGAAYDWLNRGHDSMIIKNLQNAADKLDSAADKHLDAASKLRGGAGLSPAGEDR